MKKFFFYPVFAVLTLASCKKDLSADLTGQEPSVEPTVMSASNRDVIVRIDVTGQQVSVPNPCTGGPLTFLSGNLQLNIAPDGQSIRSTTISQMVVQDDAGNIYHGVYVETFEFIVSDVQGTLSNTFKLILSPQGGGTNVALHGVLHITVNANGIFTAIVDPFILDCH
jgi:hypothetical protein